MELDFHPGLWMGMGAAVSLKLSMSIRVTTEIRSLLAELDHAVEEFDGYTAALAGNTVSQTDAVKLGGGTRVRPGPDPRGGVPDRGGDPLGAPKGDPSMRRSPKPTRAEARAAGIAMRMALRFYRSEEPWKRIYFRGIRLGVQLMLDALPQCRFHEAGLARIQSLARRSLRIIERAKARRSRKYGG